MNKTIIFGGPVIITHGLSMLIFPQCWSGPDGIEMVRSWRAAVWTFVLGLLLGFANLFAVDAVA